MIKIKPGQHDADVIEMLRKNWNRGKSKKKEVINFLGNLPTTIMASVASILLYRALKHSQQEDFVKRLAKESIRLENAHRKKLRG